jgi:N-acetylneuraminic acid mutarotase
MPLNKKTMNAGTNRKVQLNYIGAVLFLALISLFSSITSTATFVYGQTAEMPDTWKSMTSMPTSRAQLGVAVVNGRIYAIGGSSNDRGPILLNVTEEYNPATNTWTTKAPMPTARHSFGVAVYEDKIYCFGGSTNGPELAVNEVYNPSTGTWETKTPMPTARAALSANTVNGKIYLMGGNPANRTNEVYDPSTDSWTTQAQMPEEVLYSESAVVNDKIYVFGGLSNRNSTSIYDPTTDTWASGASLPTGVAEGAAAATAGVNAPARIYVMGGESTYVRNGATFGNFTDLNQVYDPEKNTWTMGTRLPTELRFFGLAVANDTLYAMGGFPGQIDFLKTNYQYTPIGYGVSVQEPSPLTPILLVLVLTAIAIAVASVYSLLLKRRRKYSIEVES